MTDEQIASIGSNTTMDILIKASCDNYDRIGNVNLALVPKGQTTYNSSEVSRIELGRFITPFMNKNIAPDTVPYSFTLDYLKNIVKDNAIASQYDFWLELEVFGVPYAANTQVAGCSGRNDVFFGTLSFTTSTPAVTESNNILIPLLFKFQLYNYDAAHTDVLGQTVKTSTFNLTDPLTDSRIIFITSNHGANTNGEEYSRRVHYVYFDDFLKLTYTPGRETCEPFRSYNTQSNGIYGTFPKTNTQWQSFSNWCPGDVIDNRVINTGTIASGAHSFKLNVPQAVFYGNDGYFPFSAFVLGKTSGTLSTEDIDSFTSTTAWIYPNPTKDFVKVDSKEKIKKISVFDVSGQKINEISGNNQVNIENLPKGNYFLHILFENGQTMLKKVLNYNFYSSKGKK